MDLLRDAYSTASDEDDDKCGHSKRPVLQPYKRPRPAKPSTSVNYFPTALLKNTPNYPIEAPLPGRYISKRERAVLASSLPADTNATPLISSPGSILSKFCGKSAILFC